MRWIKDQKVVDKVDPPATLPEKNRNNNSCLCQPNKYAK